MSILQLSTNQDSTTESSNLWVRQVSHAQEEKPNTLAPFQRKGDK
jgi:hypothetical protein